MRRIGGHVVVDALRASGVDTVFGLPGIHALAIWDGLRTEPAMRAIVLRTELAAGFAADGYARSTGRPGVLLTTTGPGAFVATAALMEARSSHVPIVNIVPQIPRALIDRDHGFLHELPGQSRVFEPLAKRVLRVDAVGAIPGTIAEALSLAASQPQGPVVVEIPVDVLEEETAIVVPEVLAATPADARGAPAGDVAHAVELLAGATRPLIWAGSGVLRAGATAELRALAERLDAPVATTYMGRGALPDSHPLAVGAACDDPDFRRALELADVVLAVGTELGAETTAQWQLALPASLIQLDVRPQHIGLAYPVAVGLAGCARPTLAALGAAVPAATRGGADRAARVRAAVAANLARQEFASDAALVDVVRAAIPAGGVIVADMTILGYWAAPYLPVERAGSFLYPQGSGTLGFAWPAALGAAVGGHGPVLAIHGDGGFAYGVSELATAAQYGIHATLLVVDSGSYGILEDYQEVAYGTPFAVQLHQPDFTALARAYGIAAFPCERDGLAAALADALAVDGPAVVHLRATLGIYDFSGSA